MTFADDTSIKLGSQTKETLVSLTEQVSEVVVRFMACIMLKLNANKTALLYFGKKSEQPLKIRIDGQEIVSQDSAKTLGLEIQSDFKFDIHCKNIVTEIDRTRGFIWRLKAHLPQSCMRSIVISFAGL